MFKKRAKSKRSSSTDRRALPSLSPRRAAFEPLEGRLLLSIRTWDGGGTDALWTNPANWVGDVTPMADDNLVFPAGLAPSDRIGQNDLLPGTRFRTITISDSDYQITGNSLVLTEGLLANQVSGTSTLNVPIALGGSLTVQTSNAGATLLLDSIDTGNLLTATFEGAGNVQVGDGGPIAGVISGGGGINKYGTGKLILYGNNTYEGLTLIRQGAINIRSDNALGAATGPTDIGSWSSLEVENNITVAEPLYIANWGSDFDFDFGGALHSVSGNNTWTGLVTMVRNGDTSVCVDAGSTLDIEGQLLGHGPGHTQRLRKFGGGVLELSGTQSNDFNGDVQVYRGTLKLNKSGGALAFNSSSIWVGDTGAYVEGLGAGDNTMGDNSAILEIAQSNQFAHIDYLNVNMLTLTLNPGGKVQFAPGVNQTVGHLVMTVGPAWSSDIDVNGGTLTVLGNLTLNAFQGSSGGTAEGALNGSPAATITSSAANGKIDLGENWSGIGGGPPTLYRTWTINDTALTSINPDLVVSVPITAPSADVGWVKQGGGTLTLSATNTLPGQVSLGAGYVQVAADNVFGTGPLSIWGGSIIADSVPHTIGNTLVGMDNNLDVFSLPGQTGALTFTAETVLFSDSRWIRVLDPAQTVVFTGTMTEGGNNAFQRNINKGGRGTLVLEGPVNMTGGNGLRIWGDGGTVVLRKNAAFLGTATNNPDTLFPAIFEVNTGGTLVLDNSAGVNLADRLPDMADVRLYGGTLKFLGANGAASTETIGYMDVWDPGTANVISQAGTGVGSSVKLTVNYFNHQSGNTGGGTVSFVGVNADLSATGSNQIVFGTQTNVGLRNGILPYATVQGSGGYDFATLVGVSGGLAVTALPASAYVTSLAAAGPTSNVKLSANETLSTSKTINALLVGPNVVVTGASSTTTLALDANNLILNAGSSLEVPYLTPSATYSTAIAVAEGATRANPAWIKSIITGSTRLSKTGRGMLVLTAPNEFSGEFGIQEGIVNIRHSLALGSTAAQTLVYHGAALELEDPSPGLTQPIQIGPEQINVEGAGFYDPAGYENQQGVLRSIRGNNSIVGTIRQGQLHGNYWYDGWRLFGTTNANFMAANFYGVDAGSTLKLTGSINDNWDLVKVGGGTLETDGPYGNGYGNSTRVKAGTLAMNKPAGVYAHAGGNWVQVGDDDPAGPDARLVMLGDDQVNDDAWWVVGSNGTVDFNGHKEILEGFWLTMGPAGASTVDLGAGGQIFIERGDGDFIYLQTIGTGNPTGARVLDGTINLTVPTYGAPGWGYRRVAVNRGLDRTTTDGADLLITSAIADGSAIWQAPLQKYGYGTLELGGTAPNTFSGQYYNWQGTTLLNKGDGVHGGVNAVGGGLRVGDAGWGDGIYYSDVVRWLQPNQLPDNNALVYGDVTGWLDLNGNDETLGVANFQYGLQIEYGTKVTTGSGTLTLNGNLQVTGDNWARPAIFSGNLNLGSGDGSATTAIDIGDAGQMPYELLLEANVSGAANVGLIKSGGGTMLLSGDNSGLAGNVWLTAGGVGLGSDTALGTGTVSLNAWLLSEFGPRTLSNPIYWDGNGGFARYFNTGANNITLTGGVTLTSNREIWSNYPQFVTFAGGIGEAFGSYYFHKRGLGFMELTAPAVHSGATYLENSGALILRDNGALLNTSLLEPRFGSTVQIDNTAVNLSDRVRDLAGVNLRSASLVYIGKTGEASTETFGELNIAGNYQFGQTLVSQVSTASGSAVGLTFANMNTNNQTNVLNFVGIGAELGGTANSVRFLNPPPQTGATGAVGSILPNAFLTTQTVVGGVTQVATDFVGYDPFAHRGIYNATTSTDLATATAADNVKISGPAALAGSKSVNALLLQGNAALALGAGVNLTLASGTLISAAAFNTAATPSVTGGTVTLSGGIAAAASANFLLTDRRTTATISSVVATPGTNTIVTGGKGTLVLAGANTFGGKLDLTEGIVRAAHGSALGAAGADANDTLVRWGSQLQLEGNLSIGEERLHLNGAGLTTSPDRYDNTGALRLVNSTPAVPQTVTWGSSGSASVVWYDHNNYNAVMVDEAGDTLTFNGVLTMNRDGYKFGAGTLEYAGTTANVQANNPIQYVHGGTLLLNKTAGVAALPVNVRTVVGNDFGGDNADVLKFGASDQIPTATASGYGYVQMRTSGLMDLNGMSETLDSTVTNTMLYMLQGPAYSGDTDLNGGTLTLGTPTVQTNIQGQRWYWGGPTGSTISDGTLVIPNAGVNVYFDEGYALADMEISANLSGAGALWKSSGNLGEPGNSGARLVLSGTNSTGFTGTVTVQAGELLLANNLALGNATTVTVGTNNVGNPGQALLLAENIGTISGKTLVLNGAVQGFGSAGALRSLGGTNEWAGNVTLQNNWARFAVDSGTLTINGVIGQDASARGMDKIGAGTLVFAGSASNTYTGNTNLYEGKLRLAKSGGAVAIPASYLQIGDDRGMGGADLVELVGPDQIGDGVRLEIRPSGKLEMNGHNDTIGELNMYAGSSGAMGAVVDVEGATLTLSGTNRLGMYQGPLTAFAWSPVPLITSSSGGAGALNLGTTQHNFDANNPLPTVDGIVAVPLTAGSGGGFTKVTGGSTILLAADNSGYTGSVTINAGYLAVDRSTSLGPAATTVTISGGAGLQAIMNDAINPAHNPVAVPNNFTLNSDFFVVGILDQAIDLQGKFANAAARAINLYNLAPTTFSGTGPNAGGIAFDLPNVAGAMTFNAYAGTQTNVSGRIRGAASMGATHTGNIVKAQLGPLTLSGDNSQFEGKIDINAGMLVGAHNNAFGTPWGYTYSAGNAAIAIKGNNLTIPETFYVGSQGYGNFGATPTGGLRMLDAQPGTIETNTLTGVIINWANPAYYGVDGAEDRLVFGSGSAGYVYSGEITSITFASAPSAGTWTIAGPGGTTASLPFNATPAQVQTELEKLSGLGPGTVRVAQGNNNYTYLVTYQSLRVAQNLTDLTVAVAGGMPAASISKWDGPNNALVKVGLGTLEFAGDTPNGYSNSTQVVQGTLLLNKSAAAAVNEVQTISLSATPTAGTWTLTFDGQTTTPAMAFNVTAAQVQSALEGLSTIGTGNVMVFGAMPNFTVFFTGALAGADVPMLIPNTTTLTAANTTANLVEAIKGGSTLATGLGNVTLGDEGGSDVIRYGALAAGNQIPDTATVTVASSGLLDLAGKSDAVGNLVLSTGPTSSARISTGAGALGFGALMNSGITVNTYGATDGTAPAARIQGNLDLGNAPRTITINDTYIPSSADDLVIEAAVSGGYAGGFVYGLREDFLAGGFNEATPNLGDVIQLTPVKAESAILDANRTYVYTGQIWDDDGIFTLAESLDDQSSVLIDGVLRIRETNYNRVGATSSRSAYTNATENVNSNPYGGMTNFGMGPAGDGWHNIEVRIGNGAGGGGAGGGGGNGWGGTKGFGYANSALVGYPAAFTAGNYVIPGDATDTQRPGTRFRVASTLTATGAGSLAMTGINTYTGPTVVSGATLTLRDGGTILNSASVGVSGGGRLVLDNLSTNVGDRIGNVSVTLNDGNLSMVGNAAGTAETVGDISLTGGASTIQSTTHGALTSLTGASLTRSTGATVEFVGTGADLGSATNEVRFTTPPAMTGGIVPYATVSGPAGLDLATDVDAGAGFSVGRLATYDASNVKVTSSTALSGNINALLVAGSGITVTNGGLTVSSGQVVNTGGANSITAGTLDFGAAEPLFFVDGGSTLSIAGSLTGTAGLRKERGGTLVLSGDNGGFSGAIAVNQGLLRAQSLTALGTSAAGTTVSSGAALAIDGSLGTLAEPLAIAGTGLNNDGSGALRVAGTNTWSGPITLSDSLTTRPHAIAVDSGVLTVTGAIGQATAGSALVKTGPGTLELGGTAVNTYSGTTTISAGTLVLNKTAGGAAMPYTTAVIVGDNDGGSAADQLVYGPSANADQIPNVNVTVNRSGRLDAAGRADTVSATLTILDGSFVTNGTGNYTVNGLVMAGGSLATSGGSTFILNGNMTYNSGAQSVISGLLSMNNGDRNFYVNDGPQLYDLRIDADITGGGTGGRFSKQNAGALLLTGDNKNLTGRSEVQTVSVPNAVSAFTLSFHGATTNPIPNSPLATADQVRAALELLPSVGVGNVTVTQSGTTTITYTITFVNNLGGFDIWQMAASGVGGTVTTATPTGGVWGFAVLGGAVALGSDTALGLGGVAVNNSTIWAYGGPRTIKWLHTGNNSTSYLGARRDWGPVDGSGNPYPLYAGSEHLWQGTTAIQVDDPLAYVQIGGLDAKQLVSFQAAPTAGTWTLTFNGATTSPLAFDATAAQVEVALNGLSSIGGVGGSVTVTPAPGAYGFQITFGGSLKKTDVALVSVATGGLTPTTAPVVAVLARGNGGVYEGEANRVLTKNGNGRLILGGPGTYNGQTTVNSGILTVRDSNAFGTSATLVYVANLNAGLEIDGSDGPVNITNKGLQPRAHSAAGVGYASGAFNSWQGIVRNVAGNNSWTTGPTQKIFLQSNDGNARYVWFGVEAGSSLDLVGEITGINNSGAALTNMGLVKVGGGTLITSGAANTWNGSLQILDGTFVANKAASTAAVSGTVYVGDPSFGSGADVFRMAASHQVADASAINVYTSGRLELAADVQETLGVITGLIGDASSASVALAAGSTLFLGGDPVFNAFPGMGASTPAAIGGPGTLGLLASTATAAGTRTITINAAPAGDALVITAPIGDGANGSYVAGLTKAGWTASRLVLNPAADSTYRGLTTINAGIVNIRQAKALGAADIANPNATGTYVNNGATLEVQGGITVTDEYLRLQGAGNAPVASPTWNSGPGFPWNGAAWGTGTLRAVSGDNVWTETSAAALIGTNGNVDIGFSADAGASLDIKGILAMPGGWTVVKSGPGTVIFSSMNDVQGTSNTGSSGFRVIEGTAVLNKAGTDLAFNNTVYVGDGWGGDNIDILRYGASAGGNQIGGVTVGVRSSGLLDLNGKSDSIGALGLEQSLTSAGDVTTGAGTITLTSDLYTLVYGGTTGASPAAGIAGNLNLNSGYRTVNVRGSNAPVDLVVSAVLSNGGIAKWSPGTLELANTNTYAGQTAVVEGTVVISAPGALGTVAGATNVNNGATLAVRGNITDSLAEPLVLAGSGRGGAGALLNLSGANSLAGPVTLATTTPTVTIGSLAGHLTLGGNVDMRLADLLVSGAGDVTLNGAMGANLTSISNGLLGFYYRVDTAPNSRTSGTDFLQPPIYTLETLVPQYTVATPRIDFGDGTNTAAGYATPVLDRGGGDSAMFQGLIPALTAANQIAGLWIGQINVPEDAWYRFTTRSDDGSVLYIDGVWVVHNNYSQGVTNRSGDIYLTAGPHQIKVGGFEGSGGNAVQASWEQLTGAGPFARRIIEETVFSFSPSANAVIKEGAGTLTLAGNSTYAGTTTVNGGTLLVNGNNSAATGAVTVAGGATLGGTGTVGGSVTNSGVVTPGLPTPTTAVLRTGSATFAAGSSFDVQLNGPTLGADYDQLKVTGAVDLGGATLNIVKATGYVPANGYEIILIDNDGTADAVNGTFAGLAEGATITLSGVPFTITYQGGDGNDVALEVVVPVGVYVDDSWAGTPVGATPATSAPAGLIFGYNAFDVIQDGIDQVGAGGGITVYGGAYSDSVNVNKALAPIQLAVNPNLLAETLVDITAAVTLGADAAFQQSGAASLRFGAAINGTAGTESLTVNGANAVTFDGPVGTGTALDSLTTDAGGSTVLGGGQVITTGDQVYADPMALTAHVILSVGGSGSSARDISGAFHLTKAGAGTLTLTGTNLYLDTTIGAGTLQVGNGGVSGTLGTGAVLDNGALVFHRSDLYTVANAISGSGTVTQSGSGTTVLSGNNSYGGATAVNAGTLVAAQDNALGGTAGNTTVAAGAALGLQGGVTLPESLVLNGAGVGGAGALVNLSGTNAVSGAITLGSPVTINVVVGSDVLTLSGIVSGIATADLTKIGAGTLTLTAANDYLGATHVNVGTLLVNGDQSAATGAVAVASGATLGGTGTVGGAVTAQPGGIVSPGTSPGRLTVASVTVASTAEFHVELDGTTVATGYDQLSVAGAVNLGGSTLVLSRSFSPAAGVTFVILDGTSPVVGEFAGMPDGSLVDIGGLAFRIDYQGGDGNDVVLERVPFALGSLVIDAGDAGLVDDALHATSNVHQTSDQQGRQHSVITRIVVTLSGVVTSYDSGAFTLERRGSGGGPITLNVSTVVVGGSTTITLTFNGASPYVRERAVAHDIALSDGDYRFDIDMTKIRDTEGYLPASADRAADDFFSFFGDSDGDRDVDATDLNRIRRVILNDPNFQGYKPVFDYDGSGTVDATDYTPFRAHYGKKLKAAPGALHPSVLFQLRSPLRRT